VAAAIAVAVVLPSGRRSEPAVRSPRSAAAVAEATVPRLGLVWGKLRAWQRAGAGWLVLWQPAHGAWVVRAWVPDTGPEVAWWLEVAPWLPGARLSRAAAAFVAGNREDQPIPQERLGRRDWAIGADRVVGGMSAGRRELTEAGRGSLLWGAVLAGLLLAGATSRALVPVVVEPGWRRLVGWTAVLGIVSLPALSSAAVRAFAVGVRPWIGQMVFAAIAALLLATAAVAAVRYAAGRGRAPGHVLGLALAAGLLAGRLQPVGWCAAVAGLSLRGVAWLTVIIVGGWLAGLAGEGLRQLTAPAGSAGRAVLAALGVAMVATAGPWLGVAAAVLGAAAGGRGQGTPVAVMTVWGWLVGATWATCAWTGPVRDSLLLLLAGAALVGAATIADRRHGV